MDSQKFPLRVEENSDRIEEKNGRSVDLHIEALKELTDEELLDYGLFIKTAEYAVQAELGSRGEELCKRFDELLRRHFHVPSLNVPLDEPSRRKRRPTVAEIERVLSQLDLGDL